MKVKKRRQKRPVTLWLWAVALSRFLYVFFAQEVGIDTYAYGAIAMAGAGKTELALTSGLAYAYVQQLSLLLSFVKNDLIWVSAYQTLLQIAWLVLIFFGVRTLWGKFAAYISGTVLLVSPFILQSVKTIEPVNFLLFHFAVLLFLYSVFCDLTAKKGWHRSNAGELFLIFTGCYMGVICIWNYVGFLLLPVMLYVLVKNRSALREELWKQKNIELRENEQLMPAGSQGFILVTGMLVGMFATLMKYTGLTGNTVWEQLFWWSGQFLTLPGRCQDVSFFAFVWLIAALALGIVMQGILECVQRKQKERQELENIRAEFAPENGKQKELAEEEMQGDYFTTKDGRVVKYIDNPLPGPKKHVKKEMSFAIDDAEGTEKVDDFDYKIDEDSDFDFD